MTMKSTILSLFLLIALSASSQNGLKNYKLITSGVDTFMVVDVNTIMKLNVFKIENLRLNAKLDTCTSLFNQQQKMYTSSVDSLMGHIKGLYVERNEAKRLKLEADTIMMNDAAIIKLQDKKIKRLKILGPIGITAVGIGGFFLGVYATKP